MMSTKSSSLTEETSKEERFERPAARLLFVWASVSIYSVLTSPSLVQPAMLPSFLPAIPPALCGAMTFPEKVQEQIKPLFSLIPAIPPASS